VRRRARSRDITAILDQQKPDPAKAAAARAAADAQPPAGATPIELANFYYRRATDAGEIGRLIQRRDDAKEAVRLGREARVSPQMYSFYLALLTQSEVATGNIRAAMSLSQERWNATQSGSPTRVGAAATSQWPSQAIGQSPPRRRIG